LPRFIGGECNNQITNKNVIVRKLFRSFEKVGKIKEGRSVHRGVKDLGFMKKRLKKIDFKMNFIMKNDQLVKSINIRKFLFCSKVSSILKKLD
jgi:hypothetical protein